MKGMHFLYKKKYTRSHSQDLVIKHENPELGVELSDL